MSVRIEDGDDRLIVWNRAEKRGALTPELYHAIMEAADQARQSRIRALVLAGEGPYFCAGGDLNVLIERRALPEDERHEKIGALHDMIRALRGSPVPVVAAVEGGAAGAGLSIALACDMIVSAEDAKYTAAYVKAGLVPDGGLTASLARCMPRQMAMEICLLGKPIPAARMAEIGVVTTLTAPGDAVSVAMKLADQFAQGPREAQRVIRHLVASAYDQTEEQQLDAEQIAMARAQGADEAGEGIAAFLEKRPARF